MLNKLFRRSAKSSKKQNQIRRRQFFQPMQEQLEARQLMAVDVWVGGDDVLNVMLDEPGDVAYITNNGDSGVRVGTTENGADKLSDAFDIERVAVSNDSADADVIAYSYTDLLTAFDEEYGVEGGYLYFGDEEEIQVTILTEPEHGVVEVHGDGSFDYVVDEDYAGWDSFTYRLTQDFRGVQLTSNIATATINTMSGDETSEANYDFYTVHMNESLSVDAIEGVLSNDFGIFSVEIDEGYGPYNGTVDLDSDGSFVYTPMPGYTGQDFFDYITADGTWATVTIDVVGDEPLIDMPEANYDFYTVHMNESLSVDAIEGVLSNDFGIFSVEIDEGYGPYNGTVDLDSDGSFVYTPMPGYTGQDFFDYITADGTWATVTIDVVGDEPLIDMPEANYDFYTVHMNESLSVDAIEGVLSNDFGIFSVEIDEGYGPYNGTVDLDSDGSFVYTPMPGYTGQDFFDYITADGTWATVTIDVVGDEPLIDMPEANYDFYTVHMNESLSVDAIEGVLSNDFGIFSVEIDEGYGPYNGTVDLDSDGSFVYTPMPGYTGQDFFDYITADGTWATVTIDVVGDEPLIDPITDEPIDNTSVSFSLEFTDVYGNVIEQVGQGDDYWLGVYVEDHRSGNGVYSGYLDVAYDEGLTSVADTWASHGPGYDSGQSGEFRYGLLDELGAFDGSSSPIPSESRRLLASVPFLAETQGEVLFESNAADLSPAHDVLVMGAESATPTDEIDYGWATISIVQPMVVQNDNVDALEDAPREINVLDNDDENVSGGLSITHVSPLTNGGNVVIDADGRTLLYTPASDFSGEESFVYHVVDRLGNVGHAQVTVNVANVNDAPIANDDWAEHILGDDGLTGGLIEVLANDTAEPDVDDMLTLVDDAKWTDQGGWVTVSNGQVHYTPEEGFIGQDTFTYTVRDSEGLIDMATVTVDVRPPAVDSPWQNPLRAHDVNDDGEVTTLDAIKLLNELSETGPRLLSDPTADRHLDVSGDGFLSPIDVLMTINEINRQAQLRQHAWAIDDISDDDDDLFAMLAADQVE